MGEWPDAAEAFSRCITINPNNDLGNFAISYSHNFSGRLPEIPGKTRKGSIKIQASVASRSKTPIIGNRQSFCDSHLTKMLARTIQTSKGGPFWWLRAP